MTGEESSKVEEGSCAATAGPSGVLALLDGLAWLTDMAAAEGFGTKAAGGEPPAPSWASSGERGTEVSICSCEVGYEGHAYQQGRLEVQWTVSDMNISGRHWETPFFQAHPGFIMKFR